jgi:two-component system sensor kinase FixL
VKSLPRNAIGVWLRGERSRILPTIAALIVLIAFVDWRIGNRVSLGILYIIPMMLGAVVLDAASTALLAAVCALLRSAFDTPATEAEVILRFAFSSVAYFACGRFVTALVRNRELVVEHLSSIQREQELRVEAEEQFRELVESSPAAVLTLNHQGVVIAANHAAEDIFSIPDGETLIGRVIASYLPLLSDALHLERIPETFRTAAQCQGRRANGDIFLAHTWFSSYQAGDGTRLAAIVVDSSEEMRDREEQNLRLLRRSNRIAAAAVSHEVRNLCQALSMLGSHLEDKLSLHGDEDFQGLLQLIKGLDQIAGLELQSRVNERLEEVALRTVLDHLRIVIESDWREIGGVIRWTLPVEIPIVVADSSGLLQAFLNLARNSHRAVEQCLIRELNITVSVDQRKACVSFQDTGPGVVSPECLFQPFQPGADGTGLGLYVSRAVVRSYGGELRYQPTEYGSCFSVELQVV